MTNSDMDNDTFKQGPQERLCQTAGAAAPSRGSEAQEAGSARTASAEMTSACKLRPQDWLCQTAGGATPSAGSEPHAAGSVGAIFQWPVRVYWEDTDAGGIVFYANYLKFFERSRTEWLRSLGIEQQRLKDATGCMFVVTETVIRYHRPARLDDELIVTASLVETGRASMIIKQQALLKAEQPGVQADVLLCEGTIRIGWVQGTSLRPRRIPAAILDSLPPDDKKAST
ncbi:MAG: thioesterase superfamily protein [Polaromonas sp.]|nr:thioesterase superfamily protein [Polaromonas sp.]